MDPQRPSNAMSFLFACILLGFSSMVAQIILFRELMVSFYGNELSLGILLAVWLFWVGVGSALGNRIASKGDYSVRKLSLWYFLVSVLILLTIILIRFSKQILGTAPAEIVGFIPMFFFTAVAMSFFCICLGVTFVLNSKSWQFDQSRIFSVNRVYIWESLGAALGGILVTLVLIPHISNFNIAILILSLNLLFCAFLLTHQMKSCMRILIWVGTVLVLVAIPASKLNLLLDRYSTSWMWRGLPLINSQDSKYGNIAVTKQREQITFYQNGLMLFSYPDDFSAEEAVHYALLEHPQPKNLLLIGGGVGGALSQALKYQGLKIDYVEIDPELIRTAETFLPDEEIESLRDPRVKVHFMDGRLFVKKSLKSQDGKMYDVIILNLPDPNTAQLNRFYTFEFFRMIKSLLDEGGVFSFRVSSAENYISKELGLYLSSISRTLRLCFRQVKILPGSNNIFLASKSRDILFSDWQTMVERLKQRGITTSFVNEDFLPERLSQLRVEFLEGAIPQEGSRANYDLNPICYFYNSILWSKQFRTVEKSFLLLLSRIHTGWFLAAVLLIFTLVFLPAVWSESRRSYLALGAIFVAGFTSIFIEIIVVLSFQVFHGYVYSMVGLFFTLFMLGLTLGAFVIQEIAGAGKISFKKLVWFQLLQVLFILSLLIVIQSFSKSTPSSTAVKLFLFILVTISGVLGGLEFALANHVYLNQKTVRKAGTGYSFDLFGASLSSILASAVLIPLLGIPFTLIMILLVNLVCFCFLLLALR
jgi:spermidine synthase